MQGTERFSRRTGPYALGDRQRREQLSAAPLLWALVPVEIPVHQRYLSIQQAADYLGVADKTVRRWVASGRLGARRAGPRLLRIELAEIDRFMAQV
ncbi:helix-turn-helix domain-containing protein [Gordonia sp. (in: high G+C Gram-positive bacteria)]|uniref:helix-turn-helix domain-containing protein n=1 Tax=Gordonia sp. (in: high G+C Gram-positive bacteria) TaxID=84139 RepID=UPI003C75CD77